MHVDITMWMWKTLADLDLDSKRSMTTTTMATAMWSANLMMTSGRPHRAAQRRHRLCPRCRHPLHHWACQMPSKPNSRRWLIFGMGTVCCLLPLTSCPAPAAALCVGYFDYFSIRNRSKQKYVISARRTPYLICSSHRFSLNDLRNPRRDVGDALCNSDSSIWQRCGRTMDVIRVRRR